MLIGAFADNILEELDYQTIQQRKLDRRNIILRADEVRSELLANTIYNATRQGDNYIIKYDKEFSELPDIMFISRTAKVLKNDLRGRYYSDMPSAFVSFGSQNGIRMIRPIQDNSIVSQNDPLNYFIAQKAGAGLSYGMLESAQLAGGIGYEIEGQQIFYNNMLPGVYDEILITYLPALSGLKETDEMPCPAEFISMLATKVKNEFQFQRQYPADQNQEEK